MKLTVTGKQMDVGDAMRTHIQTVLDDVVDKHFQGAAEGHVTISRVAHLFHVEITVHAGRGLVLQGSASAPEPYPAFDQASTRISKRLARYKTKLKARHHETPDEEALHAPSFVLQGHDEDTSGEATDNPVIVAEMTTPIELLTVSEAVMRLDLGDLPALMFRNRAHGGLNMIYRRSDGHVGWVDPRGSAALTTPAASQTAARG